MRKNLSLVLMAALFGLQMGIHYSALAAEGSSGRGGGNANSPRLRTIDEWIDGTQGTYGAEPIKAIMTRIAKNSLKVGRMDEKHYSQLTLLQELVARGLIEDIEKSEYVKSKKCVDESGTEKSASTTKVNLSVNPEVGHPSVCINMLKLAADNTSYEELVGLLFHEHARHFGVEDTNEFGYQPLSDFIATRFAGLTNRNLLEAANFLPGVAVSTQAKDQKIDLYFFDSEKANKPAEIVFERLSGDCNVLSSQDDRKLRLTNVFPFSGPMSFEFSFVTFAKDPFNPCAGYEPETFLTVQAHKTRFHMLFGSSQCTATARLFWGDQSVQLADSLALDSDHKVKVHAQIVYVSDSKVKEPETMRCSISR